MVLPELLCDHHQDIHSLTDSLLQGVYEWADFLKLGSDVSDAEIQALINEQQPHQCCTLIYTSGTTGDPKAVMFVLSDNMPFHTL